MWLHFWVDMYDETWRFWVSITAAGMTLLTLANKDKKSLHHEAKKMIRGDTVLVEHPVKGLRWCQGKGLLLEGPPW